MNINTELKETEDKEYKHLYINGVDLGIWHISQLRQHMEYIDNNINVGL